jgi:hypothetical protein
MTQNKPDPISAESGEQVPAKPHDSGSAANETDDGLDATTETLKKAVEDTPSGTGADNIEKTPVFDRADLAPKIWAEKVMAVKKHGIIVETPTEARQAERGPSVLALLAVSTCLAILILGVVWFVFFRS